MPKVAVRCRVCGETVKLQEREVQTLDGCCPLCFDDLPQQKKQRAAARAAAPLPSPSGPRDAQLDRIEHIVGFLYRLVLLQIFTALAAGLLSLWQALVRH
jgi:hypothetical protein